MLTFASTELAGNVVELDVILVNGLPRLISFADSRKVYVKVFYLPCEVDNTVVKDVMLEFGHVLNIQAAEFPADGEWLANSHDHP